MLYGGVTSGFAAAAAAFASSSFLSSETFASSASVREDVGLELSLVVSSGGSDVVVCEALSSTTFTTSAAGSAGGSMGPNHPSCKPLTYSFHAFLPITMSPFSPGYSCTPILSLSGSSTEVAVSSNATPTLSPCLFLYLRILSASAALTSPSRLPSTTSQSIAAATRIGLTYSTKCSRLELKLSAGGAVRKMVILRGS